MTHTKTPHKHRDIIRSYIDDTSLCVFVKLTPHEKWKVVEQPAFLFQCEYFICLPKHKDAVFNLLNGGESQLSADGLDWFSFGLPATWERDRWYMSDAFESRIKPKKVKRVIATYMDCNGVLRTTDLTYDSASHLMREAHLPVNCSDLTLHEIEIEV